MDEKERSFNWLHKSQEKYGFVYRGKTIGEDFRMKELKEESSKRRRSKDYQMVLIPFSYPIPRSYISFTGGSRLLLSIID